MEKMVKSIKQLSYDLAKAYYDSGRNAEALEMLKKALAEPDEDQALRVDVLLLSGHLSSTVNQPGDALKSYAEAISLSPRVFSEVKTDLDQLARTIAEIKNGSFNQILDNLQAAAESASSGGDPALAEAILKWVAHWRPEDEAVSQSLSNVLIKQGKVEESINILKESAKPGKPAALSINLAQAYLESGKYDEAVQIFNKLLEKNPDDLAALKGRGTASRHQHKLDESLADLQRAVDLDSQDALAFIELALTKKEIGRKPEAAEDCISAALLYIDTGNNEEALRCAELAAQLDRSNWYPPYLAGTIYNNIKKYDDALEKLQTANKLTQNADVLVEMSKSNYLRGNFEQAIQYADQALAINPDLELGMMYKGSALIRSGKNEEGLAIMEKVIALQPEDLAWCYTEKAFGLENLGRDEEALAAFAYAVYLDPTNRLAQGYYGRQLRWNNRQEEALVHLNEAIRLYGSEMQPDIMIQKAHSLYDIGRYEEAMQAYDELLAFDPTNSTAACYKGISLRLLGRYSEAVTSLQIAIDLDAASEKKDALPYSEQGEALRLLERFREAETSLRKALEINSEYQPARATLGEVLRGLNQFDQAVEELKIAVSQDENDYRSWSGLAATYYQQDKYKSGLEAAEKALALSPQYTFALSYKGLIQQYSNRLEQARTTYQQLLELQPDDAWTLMQMAILLRVQDMNQCAQALALLDKIIEIDPNYPLAYAQRSICLYHLGKYADAISAASREIESDPSQIWVHQVERLCYERMGESEKAEHADELALESSTYNQSLVDRARNYSALRAYSHAERDLRKAMADSPDDFYAYNGLAWLLAEEMKERLDEAEQLAANALELIHKVEDTVDNKVDVAQLMDTHAWILFRLGRGEEALRELMQALAVYDENLEMHDHLAVIQSAVPAE